MKALSLFSGIGGIDLACEWAGIETVAFCEREPFPQKVLRKHWPDVPIYDDVCTLTKERLEADGIDCSTIGLISAGYPCQPYSVAGERQGSDDDRALWPEVKRLLEEIRPRWFVGENVAGHVTLGLDGVLSDLDDIGYTCQPVIIPAAAVGALHRRDRVFILAHSGKEHVQGSIVETLQREQALQRLDAAGSAKEWADRSNTFEPKILRSLNGISGILDGGMIDVNEIGNEEKSPEGNTTFKDLSTMWERSESGTTSPGFNEPPIIRDYAMQEMPCKSGPGTWQASEKGNEEMCCMQQGIPSKSHQEQQDMRKRMLSNNRTNERKQKMASNGANRLKALGNAVAPPQIYPILAAIKQIDDLLQGKEQHV